MDLKKVQEVFTEAAAIASEREREAYLEKACEGDDELRAQVEELLRSREKVGGFMEAPLLDEQKETNEFIGTRIGPYKLLEQIGEGGFGVVYMAEQEEPVRRKVALKIIKAGMDTKQVIARFEAERQALAMMEHPNIAKVLDGGETGNGRPYFVMELVKGIPITEFCEGKKLDLRKRLELFIKVCHAVQHAHQKGIIHRDLKPSNVMITVVDGQPVAKVIDFGVAKAIEQKLTEKTLFTRYDQLIGTPAYMSPEQAELSGQDVDTRSDIYSLGCVLYELLTGTAPIEPKVFSTAGLDEIRRIIREVDPPCPSTQFRKGSLATRGVSPERSPPALDLDWIVMKCLEKDRGRRYESANELGLDIQRHLNHETVLARPPSGAYQLQKLVRRHQIAFGVGAGMAVVLLFASVISSWMFLSEKEARQVAQEAVEVQMELRKEAERERSRAKEQELLTRQHLYATDMALVQMALEAGDWQRATYLLDRNRPKPGEKDLRHWEWRYLRQLCQSDEEFTLGSHTERVKCVAVSPNNRTVITGSNEHLMRVWDMAERREIATIPQPGRIYAVDFSRDGTFIASGHEKGFDIWEARSLRLVKSLVQPEVIFALEFSADGKHLATFCQNGEVRMWRMTDWSSVKIFRTGAMTGGDDPQGAIAFSPTGERLAIADLKGTVVIVDAFSGNEISQWQAHTGGLPGRPGGITELSFAPDGETLASSSWDSTVRVWRVSTGELIRAFTNHTAIVFGVSFSPDGRTIASAGTDQSVRLWHPGTGEELLRLQGHLGEIMTLAYCPDGKRVVTGGKEGSVKVWNTGVKRQAGAGRTLEKDFEWFSFFPDSTLLGWDGFERRKFSHEWGMNLVFRPEEGLVVFSTGEDLHFFRPDGRPEITTIRAHREDIQAIALSVDGRMLATAGQEGVAKLWDVDTGKECAVLRGHQVSVTAVAFSPDGRRLMTGAGEVLKLWDLATLQEVLTLKFPTLTRGVSFEKVQFSPDGTVLAAIGVPIGEKKARGHFWSVPAWEELSTEREGRKEAPESFVRVRAGKISEAPTIPGELVEQFASIKEIDHPHFTHIVHAFASALYAQSDFPAAETIFRRVVPLARKHFGEGDVRVVISLLDLASALYEQGKLLEAVKFALEAIEYQRALGGENEAPFSSLLAWLTGVLLEAERYEKAEKYARECLELRRKIMPEDWRTYNAEALLGAAFMGQRNYVEAEPLLLSGYRGMQERVETIPPEGKGRVVEALERLIEFYGRTNREEESANWRRTLMEMEQAEANGE